MKSQDSNKNKDVAKKGDGTMSALVQRYSYNFGKKKSDKCEQAISKEELDAIKKSLEKYLPKKK